MTGETLLDQTRRLVLSSDMTYAEIARKAAVGIDWLKQIMRAEGSIKEPGVLKVQRVFNVVNNPTPRRLPSRSQNLRAPGNG